MGKIWKAVWKTAILLWFACMLGSCGLEEWMPDRTENSPAYQEAEAVGTLTEILNGLLAQTETEEEIPAQGEMKAVWVSYLDLSPMLVGKTREEFAKSAEELCRNSLDAGFNTLVVQVRPFSDSFYPSQYYPWSKWASGELGKALDYDPVQILREEAARQNLAFHGWLNPMRGCTQEEMSLVPAEYPIRQWYDDPELRAENLMIVDGVVYLNPASQSVRELIAKGAEEIQRVYQTDGIHIDDYFYPPAMDFSVDAGSYEEYLAQGGTSSQDEWRRENTEEMVKALSEAVHGVDPDSQFGVSPRGSLKQNYQDLYIDVEQWIQSGYLDYIAPQIYYGFENEAAPFEETALQWDSLAEAGGIPLIVGLAAYKIGKPDQYAGSGASEWIDSPDLLARQIEFSRELASYGGVMLFRYDSIVSPEAETAEAVSEARSYWEPLLEAPAAQP